jgi:hypothetical protein
VMLTAGARHYGLPLQMEWSPRRPCSASERSERRPGRRRLRVQCCVRGGMAAQLGRYARSAPTCAPTYKKKRALDARPTVATFDPSQRRAPLHFRMRLRARLERRFGQRYRQRFHAVAGI